MSSAQMIPDDLNHYSIITGDGELVKHDWLYTYDLVCYACGYGQLTQPSIFHKMGQNLMGYGQCLECKVTMQVVHDPEANTMNSQEVKGE